MLLTTKRIQHAAHFDRCKRLARNPPRPLNRPRNSSEGSEGRPTRRPLVNLYTNVSVHQRPAVTQDGLSPPEFKFESFHFRYCIDILCSNSMFIWALQQHGRTSKRNKPLKKHRRTEGGKNFRRSTYHRYRVTGRTQPIRMMVGTGDDAAVSFCKSIIEGGSELFL